MLREKKGKLFKFSHLIVFLLLLILYFFVVLNPRDRIDVSEYILIDDDLPESFNGYRISHVSDFHNKDWSDKNKISRLIEASNPDIIVITGDLVDSRTTNPNLAYQFIDSINNIAPIYFVTGNHEVRVDYEPIKKELEEYGVTILDNRSLELEKNGEKILLMGLEDPAFTEEYNYLGSNAILDTRLNDEKFQYSGYRILLSHRPEAMEAYSKAKVDLVFSGHAHGGQFVLPFVGGVIAPDQGFFPKYWQGFYQEGVTKMFVSRGLGDSIIPYRVNNNYHLITVEIRNK